MQSVAVSNSPKSDEYRGDYYLGLLMKTARKRRISNPMILEQAYLSAGIQRRLFGCPDLAKRLALRGGQLLAAFGSSKYRPSCDTDMVIQATPEQRDGLLAAITAALSSNGHNDGLVCDMANPRFTHHGGETSLVFHTQFGREQFSVRLDIVFVEHLPEGVIELTTTDPIGNAYTIRGYSREMAMAEKLVAYNTTHHAKHLWDIASLAEGDYSPEVLGREIAAAYARYGERPPIDAAEWLASIVASPTDERRWEVRFSMLTGRDFSQSDPSWCQVVDRVRACVEKALEPAPESMSCHQ